MESRDAISSAVTVVGSDDPSEYHVTHRSEIPAATGGGGSSAAVPAAAPPHTAAAGGTPVAMTVVPGKKKRGRPRKYGPDGSVAMALSPKPISSSAPPPQVIDFSADSNKRGKVRPPTSSATKSKFEVENIGT